MTETVPSASTIDGGTVWLLRLLDIAEQVDLDRARVLANERGARRGATKIRGPEKGPGGVTLQVAPVAIEIGTTEIEGMAFRTSVRLFDFGVVSVRFALQIAADTPCDELPRLAARLEGAPGIDDAARGVWARLAIELAGAIRGSHESEIVEDYALYEITCVRGCSNALDALARLDPARLLLAEPDRTLAAGVTQNHIARAIQYYADDAAVIDWNAALVLDPDGSRDELEVLEIATARLLELRYYDQLLARELSSVYAATEAARSSRSLFRSPFVRVARRAATLFVEMTELYDRVEGALALVGDAYSARLYREAALRFRLEEISAGVREKLGTLARVSEVFQAEVTHRRGVVLEIAVVVLIVIELLLSLWRR